SSPPLVTETSRTQSKRRQRSTSGEEETPDPLLRLERDPRNQDRWCGPGGLAVSRDIEGRQGQVKPRETTRLRRRVAFLMLLALLVGGGASASGPVAPEVGHFAPLDEADLVDHFTGDFRYSVPLMTVPGPNGGYP